MQGIRVGIVGVGNCASSLLQGVEYYRRQQDPADSSAHSGAETPAGLMHWEIGGYRPGDLEVALAFDVDARKVGKDVAEAMFAPPNCTQQFCADLPPTGVKVQMAPLLDGVPDHMREYPDARRFVVSDWAQPEQTDVVRQLRDAGVEVLLNYLPVGAESATRFWAECALRAGCAFINNIPVFIASDPDWAGRFAQAGLPIIGDDIKAQLGATITHRTLAELFHHRGVQLDRTYQLNTGGNTDFLNMLNRARLSTKKISKTEAVQSAAGRRLPDDQIHVGPSDYVPWQGDNKVCFIRMEGRLFGDVPMNLELRLSVEDSPNSAGVAIDAVRCCKLALERKMGGVLRAPSAYFCKHPLEQISDETAYRLTEAFINEGWRARKSELTDSGKPAKVSAGGGTSGSKLETE
ncbi:inositol-3-phosphate synthase [Gilvimarinus sp. F26214L]|uniref:inositol-3-phosphate synthase n=1 Tax=Gilvimarinus sp. DZF01 TaxID=3461371 RepID=UPI0040465C8B